MIDRSDIIKNKYLRWYEAIVQSAKERKLQGYVEKHHVLPLSMGGSNSPDNIIEVTAREHFILHALLTRFTTGKSRQKMFCALSYFCTDNKNHNRQLTARQYAIARQAYSAARKGVLPSEKCRNAVSAAKKGSKVSETAKKKIGEKLKKRLPFFIYDGKQVIAEGDFYRFCDEHGIGRANIQAKMKRLGVAVITAGKYRGWAFSFENHSIDIFEAASKVQCTKSRITRKVAVKKQHRQREVKTLSPVKVTARAQEITEIFVPEEITVLKSVGNLTAAEIYERREKGEKLFIFFEDELRGKTSVINSMLKNSLGKNQKISARETQVSILQIREARDFLNHNHLRGAGPGAELYIGLKHREKLVAVMSFGKARYNKLAKYELLRFASLLGVTVVGGASKLMKHALLLLNGSIVSYADLRYGNGKVYRQLGFKFMGLTKPGYWYVKDGKRHHRSQFQKHKLPGLLANFDPGKTEVQNMLEHGFVKELDAGHAVYIIGEIGV